MEASNYSDIVTAAVPNGFFLQVDTSSCNYPLMLWVVFWHLLLLVWFGLLVFLLCFLFVGLFFNHYLHS